MSENPFASEPTDMGAPAPEQDDGDELLDSVAHELFEAVEKKDAKGFRDALEALVLHIQDEDKKQDEGEK